ncbi:VOC family protein [Nocardia sp. NPDC004278]
MSRIFGQIAQIGYVVRDIRAAMDHFIENGVGPWFYVHKVETDYFTYRGVDSPLEMSVALANSGDVQLELIQQRNDAPSLYRDFLDSGREGAQHIAYWTTDFQTLYDRALSLGYVVGQEGSIGGEQGRFAYLDTEHTQGTIIEISDISGPKGEVFKYIREVAATWDGTDPIRGDISEL